MEELLYIGQWQGFFEYGPEYGDFVQGHQAEFRLFIEAYQDGQFSGRIIDWEGLGANGEVADVKGFIDEDLISFTKQYPQMHTIDKWGNSGVEQDVPGHKVVYEGRFEKTTKSFVGTWEINTEVEHTPESTLEYVMTGTWRMHRSSPCA